MRIQSMVAIIAGALLLAACASQPRLAEVTVVASEFKFEPASLEVPAGTLVRLTTQNTGTVEHDLSFLEIPMLQSGAASTPMAGHEMGNMEQAPQLHAAAMNGQSVTVEFTPTKPGAYDFFYSVPGHKEAGMVGVLTVTAR